jgi:hypothetical protein
MWGPVGAFLGVPILLCGMVALRRLSSTGSENAGLHTPMGDWNSNTISPPAEKAPKIVK